MARVSSSKKVVVKNYVQIPGVGYKVVEKVQEYNQQGDQPAVTNEYVQYGQVGPDMKLIKKLKKMSKQ